MRRLFPVYVADWRFQIGLFVVVTLLQFISLGHLTAFTPLFLSRELHVPQDEVARWTGLIAATPLLVAIPLIPLWGALADRYSRKLVLLRSLAVEVTVYGLVSVVSTPYELQAAMAVKGLSFASVAITISTVSLVAPRNRVGLAVGLVHMCVPLATSLGPPIGSVLINLVGLRGMYVADAVFALAAATLLAVFFREPTPPDRSRSILEIIRATGSTAIRVAAVRWNYITLCLLTGATGIIETFTPVLITHLVAGPETATAIGLVLGGYGLIMGVGSVVFGRLVDAIGVSRLLPVVLITLTGSTIGLSLSGTLIVVAVVVAFQAVPQSAILPLLTVHLARNTPPKQRSSVMGLTPLPRSAGGFLGPFLASAVSGWGLTPVFLLAAGFYMIAGLASTRLTASRHTQAPEPETA
jgi:DHA1 family multidrug resistance protein-like MFS transporter